VAARIRGPAADSTDESLSTKGRIHGQAAQRRVNAEDSGRCVLLARRSFLISVDNFFELGGHSLLLPKVLTKVRAIVPREISMVDLFRYPTVESLAAYIAEQPTPMIDDQTTKRIQDKREAGLRRMKRRRTQQAVTRTE
jgi:hypothetical protein